MARQQIVLRYGGAESRFDFQKVDREALYGRRRRIVLDAEDKPCERAELTDDGEELLRSGMTAQGYLDEEGRWVASRDLAAFGPDGDELPVIPSTLGSAVDLEGPVPAEAALDLEVKSVYLLEASELADDLRERLAKGELFRAPFSYRSDHHQDTLILLQNEEGRFAIVGRPTEPEWCDPHRIPDESYGEDDAPDELDFSFV